MESELTSSILPLFFPLFRALERILHFSFGSLVLPPMADGWLAAAGTYLAKHLGHRSSKHREGMEEGDSHRQREDTESGRGNESLELEGRKRERETEKRTLAFPGSVPYCFLFRLISFSFFRLVVTISRKDMYVSLAEDFSLVYKLFPLQQNWLLAATTALHDRPFHSFSAVKSLNRRFRIT